MATLSKEDITYTIDDYDLEVIEGYLQEVEKRSHAAYKGHKGVVLKCLNYINKPLDQITMLDVKNYLQNSIDVKKIKLSSKETKRSYLKSFFYYVQGIFLSQNINFQNPVPSKKVFQFTKNQSDFKKISEYKEDVFTNEELLEILELAKRQSDRDFMLFAILTITGMRLSEALTIKIENINLKERYIETGFEKDARKSNKALIFFYPSGFRPYLEKFINYMDHKSIWLFEGNKRSHLNKATFYSKIVKKYTPFHLKSHTFRRTIITNRIKMECPLLISEMLMNHTSSSVEGSHYIRLSIEEKRALYDKYFPYSSFPYF